MKHAIEFPAGKQYRPEAITVDGVEYSATLFAQKHGYNWRTSARGNILYYMSENGAVLSFRQDYLLRCV
jgi:hypothetical protein